MPEMSEDMVNENQWRDTPEFKERLEALRHSLRQGSITKQGPQLDLTLIPPVIGPVGKGYDPEVLHYGIDIMAPKNTSIKSIADVLVLQYGMTVECVMNSRIHLTHG